jgi:hypothetical protein
MSTGAADAWQAGRRGSSLAWFAVAGPPLAWVVQLAGGYGFDEAACSRGSGSSSLADAARPAVAVLTAVGVVVAIAAALAAIATLRAVHAQRQPDPRGRVAFVAVAGLSAALLFGTLVVLTGIPLISLEACPT